MSNFIKYAVIIYIVFPIWFILSMALSNMVNVISGEKTFTDCISETFVNVFDKLFYLTSDIKLLFVYSVIASILVAFFTNVNSDKNRSVYSSDDDDSIDYIEEY